MVREMRTVLQIDANKADLEVFRVVTSLRRLAGQYGGSIGDSFDAAADGISAQRAKLRRHMHPKDREDTDGA